MNTKYVDEMDFEKTYSLEFPLEELAEMLDLPSPWIEEDEFHYPINQKYISDTRETADVNLDDIPDCVIKDALYEAHKTGFMNKYQKQVRKTLEKKIMNVMGAHFEYKDYENYYIGTTGGIECIEIKDGTVKIEATEKLAHTLNAMMDGWDGSNPSGENPEKLISDTATKKDFMERFFWWLNRYYDIYGAKEPKVNIENMNRNSYAHFDDETFENVIKERKNN